MKKRSENSGKRNNDSGKPASFAKRFFGRISKIILWLLALLTAFSISLIILSQFQCFRNSALSAILLIVNDGLEAKIEIEDLNFLNFNGISLKGVRIITASDTLVSVARLTIDMDFFELPESKAIVNTIILDKPVIKLLRNTADSTWNYTRIAKPSDDIDDAGQPADWVINIRNLEIIDGTFFMIDSVNVAGDDVIFRDDGFGVDSGSIADGLELKNNNYESKNNNYESNNNEVVSFVRLGLKELNLDISANIRPAENNYSAEINSLSFMEIFSGFGLNNLSAKAELSPKKMKLSGGRITTDESDFTIDAEIKSFNVFGPAEEQAIENAFFDVDLSGDAVSVKDVKHFAEIPTGLFRPMQVDIEAVGILNELTIDKLILENEEVRIKLKGELTNLLRPENFGYDLQINRSKIPYKWLIDLFPDIDLGGVPDFGTAGIRHLHAKGNIQKAKADLNITSALGAIKGTAGINWGNRNLVYSGNLRCNNVDLSSILGSKELGSDINGNISFDGSGFDITKMEAGIKVRLAGSSFRHIEFSKLDLDARLHYGGLIQIDTLLLIRPSNSVSDDFAADSVFSEFSLEGFISVNDTNPAYSIKSGIHSMNFAEIFDNSMFPNSFSADFELAGSGFNPDSLTAVLTSTVGEYQLGDRSMFPFYIDAELSNTVNSGRSVAVRSDFADLNISGRFTFGNLISNITHTSQFIAGFISDRIESIVYKETTPARDLLFGSNRLPGSSDVIGIADENSDTNQIGDIDEIVEDGGIGDIDCRIEARIKDLSVISTFIKDLNINSSSTIDIQLKREDSISTIKLKEFHIDEFTLEQPGLVLRTDTLHLKGMIALDDTDSTTSFSGLHFNLDSSGTVSINELTISSPSANLDFDGRLLSISASATINDAFAIDTKGEVEFDGNEMYVNLRNIELGYSGRYLWSSLKPIKIVFSPDEIDIREFNIGRQSAESLSLRGKYSSNSFEDFSLGLHDFKVGDFIPIVPEGSREVLKTLQGGIDNLILNLNGTPARPAIEMKLQGRGFSYNNTFIGGITANIFHNDSNVTGEIVIDNPRLKTDNEIVKIEIDSLPMNLGFSGASQLFHSNSIVKVIAKAHDIPLRLIDEFIPGIKDITGTGKFNLLVKGAYPDNIFYRGKASFNYVEFLLEGTNLKYIADGDLDLTKDGISINNITVKNRSYDLYGGKANIFGNIKLHSFNLDSIDISLKTQKLKVLGPASKKSLPNIYGNLIIGTGNNPLRFFGTLDKPNLTGDVVIKKSGLVMPQTIQGVKTKSRVIYQIKQSGGPPAEPPALLSGQDSAGQQAKKARNTRNKNKTDNPDFADLMNYDINIQFLSNLVVQMDINALTSLKSEISSTDRTKPIRFVKKRDKSDVKIFGKMVLQDNSRLTLLKMWSFVTTGSIDFPTGSIDNPVLDLRASYHGRSNINNKVREYEVIIDITGTKESPVITFDYIINDQKATGEQSEIQKNAMTLLFTGQTSDELIGSKGFDETSAMNEAANEFLQSQLSNSLTQALAGTGWIDKAEVELSEGGIDQANVKLYGNLEFLGDVQWTFGSNVADVGNSEFSVTLPLRTIFQPEIFNNFIFQFSKFANSEQIFRTERKDWEVKIKWGSY